MQIKLSFLGAAQNITGSRHLVEANGLRVLIDCGLYQERQYRKRNWDPFPVPPESIDAVLLTHAHLDHSGFLPRFVREGFQGPAYCTAATMDIVQVMLMDSARIQEEDAEFKKKRHEREKRTGPYPEVPLYTTEDARACFPRLSPIDYRTPLSLGKGMNATFHDAGHVLGSSIVELRISQKGAARKILFSGDLGRWNKPILKDPVLMEDADYVVTESTYGDRLHEGSDTIKSELEEVIKSTVRAGGNIVIPSFALERAQEILYYFNQLLVAGRVPNLTVFLDSPMAINITGIFRHHPDLFDREMVRLLRTNRSPFDFPGLTMVTSSEESKAINRIPGSVMIIAGSGMCTGGRIKHHLVTNISRSESTILFIGYQAVGTLGRQIIDGAKEIRILGQTYPVKARITQIQGFSGHADRDGLYRWLSGLRVPPRHTFAVHSEPETAFSFADFLNENTGWKISVPEYREEAVLD
ncbi:MAG: MBL fold metallo-hydrolase [Dehalococcoidia bacterium]|nr:MBL fold metallo-hydrolase [Dehalococcoidia bacterium]